MIYFIIDKLEKIKTKIGDNNYNKGDLIYYQGKVYDCNNFYAKIIEVTLTSITIEVLNHKEIDNKILLTNMNPCKIFKNLSRRSFYIIK